MLFINSAVEKIGEQIRVSLQDYLIKGFLQPDKVKLSSTQMNLGINIK